MTLFYDKVPPVFLNLEFEWYRKIPLHISEIKEASKNRDRVKNTITLIKTSVSKDDIDDMPKIMINKFTSDFNKWTVNESLESKLQMSKVIITPIEELKSFI